MNKSHFNGLTPAQAELLAILAEECGECIQAISKVLRHGYDSFNPLSDAPENNAGALTKEMGDVRAAMIMLCDSGDISKTIVHKMAERKLESIKQWLHHQGDAT